MRILSVAPEMYPLVKTGGLADVTGAMPSAMADLDVDMRTVVPGYDGVLQKLTNVRVVKTIRSLLGARAKIHEGQIGGRIVYVVDCPGFFERVGGPYSDESGHEYSDNWKRFAAFSKAAALIGEGGLKDWQPDLVHVHDWQAAMTCAYMRHGKTPEKPLAITIHNLAFQGRFGQDIFHLLHLPETAWSVDGVEYYGGTGYLKAGLVYADAITTVSPTYAEEIRTPYNGMGLDGLLNGRGDKVHGILNGIDPKQWDPSTDALITKTYSAATVDQRQANKTALEQQFGLDIDDSPLLVVISRLTWQKGMDVLADCIPGIVARGARLAILGTGDQMLEGAFLGAASSHRGRVGVNISYNESLAHLLLAGGDGILIPSRFEPCGLTQLYGLRYGCIPIVSRVGGLADTVIHANEAAIAANAATGVVFGPLDHHQMHKSVDHFCRLYEDKDIRQSMIAAGMTSDFSWSRSAQRYVDLYRDLITKAAS